MQLAVRYCLKWFEDPPEADRSIWFAVSQYQTISNYTEQGQIQNSIQKQGLPPNFVPILKNCRQKKCKEI